MNVADLSAAIFSLLTLCLLAGSIAFWVRAIRQQRFGRTNSGQLASGQPVSGPALIPLRFRWRPVRVPRLAVALSIGLLAIAIWSVSVMALAPQKGAPSLEEIQTAVQATLGEGIIVCVVLWMALWGGTRSRTDLIRLGFRTDNIPGQLKDGGLGLVAAVLPVGVILLLTAPLRTDDVEHPFLRLLKEIPWGEGMLLIILTAVVIAPLKEELMFRVILQSWLEEYCPLWLAVLLSSTIFAAVHGFPDSLALIPLALVLGYWFQRRRSYLTIVTIHGLFNAYNLVATLVGQG